MLLRYAILSVYHLSSSVPLKASNVETFLLASNKQSDASVY
jgi:hypothetical protein